MVRWRFLLRIDQRLCVLAGSIQMLPNAIFLAERLRPFLRANIGSILHYALQCNQILDTQRIKHLSEQLIKSLTVIDAEIR